MQTENDFLVGVVGESTAGKSASLRNLALGQTPEFQNGVLFLNCEAGKRLPFPNKFQSFVITDPLDIPATIAAAEEEPAIHTILVDSLTFMMEMYETKYVVYAENTQQGWQDFQQYFKKLMQETVAASSKRIVFTAHTASIHNEEKGILETKIPVKGALKNNGIEAYFSLIVAAKRVRIKDLKDYNNPMLVITPEEEAIGYKHVYQTQVTSANPHERIRAPMNMWTKDETYIDNDINLVFARAEQYYS